MHTPVDQACDHALAASKTAEQTHSEEHHKAAKAAHEQAYALASAAGRPSLASSHLQQAAKHDAHADPTSPLGKTSAAKRATAKARASGKPEDHDAAAQAHQDAAHAHGEEKGAGGNHFSASYEHQNKAAQLRAPKRPDVY